MLCFSLFFIVFPQLCGFAGSQSQLLKTGWPLSVKSRRKASASRLPSLSFNQFVS